MKISIDDQTWGKTKFEIFRVKIISQCSHSTWKTLRISLNRLINSTDLPTIIDINYRQMLIIENCDKTTNYIHNQRQQDRWRQQYPKCIEWLFRLLDIDKHSNYSILKSVDFLKKNDRDVCLPICGVRPRPLSSSDEISMENINKHIRKIDIRFFWSSKFRTKKKEKCVYSWFDFILFLRKEREREGEILINTMAQK